MENLNQNIRDRIASRTDDIQSLQNDSTEGSEVVVDISSTSDLIEEGHVSVQYIGDRPKMSMYTEPYEFQLRLHLHDTDELTDIKSELYELLDSLYRPDDDHIVSQDYPSHRLTVLEELSVADLESIISTCD
jgi:hypothetical protein